MQLIRWSPSSDLLNLHSELDRVFNELLPVTAAAAGEESFIRAATLPLDIRRDRDDLVIEAAVPGFKPDEVEITLDGGVLTIEASHEEEREEGGSNGKRRKKDDKNYVRRERFSGRLFRQVLLGEEVAGDRAKASFKDGILTVRAPLAKRSEPKRITVSAESGGERARPIESREPVGAQR